MTIKPIKTEEDYEQALELLEQLWDAKEGDGRASETGSGFHSFGCLGE